MIINFKEIKLLPNIISSFRFLLSIPLIYIFNYFTNPVERNNYLIILILIAFISDISDGYIARKYNLISQLGKIIDPVADKTLVAILVIYFAKLKLIPIYYLIIVLLRDLLILSGGLFITKRTQKIVMSDIIGKLTVFSIGSFFLIILLNFNKNSFIYKISLFISIFMCFISLINYFIKSITFYKKV